MTERATTVRSSAAAAGHRGYYRLGAFAAIVAAIALLAVAAWEASLVIPQAIATGNLGLDLNIYLDRSRDWIAGDGFYRARQLAGPYAIEHGDAMYPPHLLYLLVPMTVLPAFLWWVVPIAIIGVSLWRLQPGPLAWPFLAFALAWPKTWAIVLYGNPALWLTAAVAAGCVWHWPAVGALLKPTMAPLALVGARHSSWWIALGVAALLALPFGGMWLDYAAVLANARNEFGLFYLLGDLPLVAAPLAAAPGLRCRTRAPRGQCSPDL